MAQLVCILCILATVCVTVRGQYPVANGYAGYAPGYSDYGYYDDYDEGGFDGSCIFLTAIVGGVFFLLGRNSGQEALRNEFTRCIQLDPGTAECVDGNCLVQDTKCVAKCTEENLDIDLLFF